MNLQGYEVTHEKRVWSFTNKQADEWAVKQGVLVIGLKGTTIMAFNHWDNIKAVYDRAVV